MHCCDITYHTPAENLACDEALLDLVDEGSGAEVLRFWEPAEHFVVVGYANRVATEVNVQYCKKKGIPILRRCSGGGTVLQGPGCLNYTLILRLEQSGPLAGIHSTNRFILGRNRDTLQAMLNVPVELQGDTDLAIEGLKICGNAQRRKRHALLFHGCFLLNLDLRLMAKTLQMPSRQPAYRRERRHSDFVRNIEVSPKALKQALKAQWEATDSPIEPSARTVTNLVREKYSRDQWNLKF